MGESVNRNYGSGKKPLLLFDEMVATSDGTHTYIHLKIEEEQITFEIDECVKRAEHFQLTHPSAEPPLYYKTSSLRQVVNL